MIYTSVRKILGTERDVAGEGWRSRRLVLAGDGLPFSVHETVVEPGSELRFCYRRHSETVYCVEGEGSIEEVGGGGARRLEPGTLYSVGIGEDHIVRTDTVVRFLCIFEPACEADETAD
jgi:L-ectoine synthase